MSQMISGDAEQQVKKLVEDWAAAERHGDATSLERILGDDYIGIGPRGFTLTRSDWLDRYNSGALRNESFNFDEIKIRLYTAAAVVTGKQTQKTKYQGQEVSGEFRVTLVLVKKADRWQLVNLQLSPILGRP